VEKITKGMIFFDQLKNYKIYIIVGTTEKKSWIFRFNRFLTEKKNSNKNLEAQKSKMATEFKNKAAKI
jgi:hypothetical protein